MSNGIKLTQKWEIRTIDERTGIIENTIVKHNVITDGGLSLIAALISNRANNKYYQYCAAGTGNRQELGSDESLQNQVVIREISDSSAYQGAARITTRFTHTGTNYDFREFGLFDSNTNGRLLARLTTQAPAELRTGKAVTATVTVNIRRA